MDVRYMLVSNLVPQMLICTFIKLNLKVHLFYLIKNRNMFWGGFFTQLSVDRPIMPEENRKKVYKLIHYELLYILCDSVLFIVSCGALISIFSLAILIKSVISLVGVTFTIKELTRLAA